MLALSLAPPYDSFKACASATIHGPYSNFRISWGALVILNRTAKRQNNYNLIGICEIGPD